jgi:hypothetical protein
MCIKPLGAGRILPGAGLRFVWSTIKPIDLVVVGMLSPEETREDIQISTNILEGMAADEELAFTRSKSMLVTTQSNSM